MAQGRSRGIRSIDWMTFSLYLSLLVIGWLMLFSVGYGDGYPEAILDFMADTAIGRQSAWVGISLFFLMFTLVIDWKFWNSLAYLIYGFGILLLLAVLVFGVTIKGATSWFSVAGFSFQPAEFAKFSTCLALAAYVSTFSTDLRMFKHIVMVFGMMVLPAVLILLQPDAGSAFVFAAFFIMFYRAGLPANFYWVIFSLIAFLILGLVFEPMSSITGLCLIATAALVFSFSKTRYWALFLLAMIAVSIYGFREDLGLQVLLVNLAVFSILGVVQWMNKKQRTVIFLIIGFFLAANTVLISNFAFNNFLQAHQRDRINVWLRPDLCDPQGSLYNIIQSKMAIGSGGFEGKGYLEGTMTKLNYVPEQATDFIFCTIGEEQGFIGSVAIILLFLILLLRIVILAERQRSKFSRYYAYGVAGILFVHVLVNIGMTMGLMPVIGIPLPFISRGGSSLLGFTLMIGVLLNLDSNRFSL